MIRTRALRSRNVSFRLWDRAARMPAQVTTAEPGFKETCDTSWSGASVI